MTDLGDVLRAALPGVPVTANAPLAPLTTFKVGGPADWLVEPESGGPAGAGAAAGAAARRCRSPCSAAARTCSSPTRASAAWWCGRGAERCSWSGPDIVRADAAVTINGLVRWTIGRGLAALEAWAGTPGTVGGAIYGNAHWRQANIGDVVESVRVMTRDGGLRQVPADRLDFDYDTSRLQQSGEILIWAAFRVRPGHDPGRPARRGPRVAGLPQADAAAGIAERRLHLPEPAAGARRGAGGHSGVGRRPGRSRRPQGARHRRRARVAGARELHRQRRHGHGRATSRRSSSCAARPWPSGSA